MLRRTLLASFLSLLLSAFAQAESCETRDFRNEIGGGYDQGFTGWCFAHSVAACLSQVTGEKVSAGAVAIDAVLTNPEDFDRLTDPDALAYLKDHPEVRSELAEAHNSDRDHFKLRRAFHYRMVGKGKDAWPVHSGIMDLGGSEDFALLIAKKRGICADAKLPSGNEIYEHDLDELATLLKKERASSPPPCAGEPASAVRSAVGAASPILRRTLEEWLDQKCGVREPLKGSIVPRKVSFENDLDGFQKAYPKGSEKRKSARQTLFSEIESNFDRGRISAIGYDYCEHGRPYPKIGECSKKRAQDGTAGSPTEDHSAILTARKMINGSCRYFLQAHVPDCDSFNDKYKTATYLEDGQNMQACEPQYGGVWISRDQLQTIYSVFSIK